MAKKLKRSPKALREALGIEPSVNRYLEQLLTAQDEGLVALRALQAAARDHVDIWLTIQPVIFQVIAACSAGGELIRHVEDVQRLCAEAYQFAGVVGAPGRVLDNLAAAAEGRALPHASILPITAEECDAGRARPTEALRGRDEGAP